jgi:DNA helicase IV
LVCSDNENPREIIPLELDLIVLSMLRAARTLHADVGFARRPEQETFLQALRTLYRTQIVVDEVTDFSPVQIAAIAALADPAANSFFACGDFNQRITRWGARNVDDLRWVFNNIDIRPIRITYRHTRQLNELARRIALLSDPTTEEALLPEAVDNEGMKPVVGFALADSKSLVNWLRDRIVEIEVQTGRLPSIAVLVTSEEEVDPVATALDAALEQNNIRAVACPDGKVVGQELDVRVFDVQHIKGLEFEAVFMVAVDRLAKEQGDIFEKYLYVGATRAATYLGLTTEGERLPKKLRELGPLFGQNWS